LPSFTLIFITPQVTRTQTSTPTPINNPQLTDIPDLITTIDRGDWGIIILVSLIWILLGTWFVLLTRQK
jgi:hypothetical protein